MSRISTLIDQGNYETLINELKEQIQQDKRVVTEPEVKEWMARRWRNLFLQEASQDKKALKVAKSSIAGRDKRPAKQKIAERYLRGDSILEWKDEMPPAEHGSFENVTLVFCAGLLNGLLPDHAFRDEFVALNEEFGWQFLRADIHPMRGCEPNTDDIKKLIDEGKGMMLDGSRKTETFQPPGDIILMGYSKGGPDILSFLAKFPEYKDRVRGVVMWAGAIGGSYTADGIYSSIKDLDLSAAYQRLTDFLKMFSPFVQPKKHGFFRRVDEFDIKGALRDLTTHQRGEFLSEQRKVLDEMNVPFFTFTAATSFLKVPTFQMHDAIRLSKYDANNDMQLTQSQAKIHIPMETHLATLHGHHWDISYPPFPRAARLGSPNLDHPFPRKAAITAIFKLLGELGLLD